MITKKLLNEKEIKKIYGFSLSLLRNNRYRGTGIPFIKIGKSVFYSVDALEKFIADHTYTSAKDYKNHVKTQELFSDDTLDQEDVLAEIAKGKGT